MTPNNTKLVERLTAKPSDVIGGGIAREWHVNPDGPEAVCLIKELVEVLSMWRGIVNEGGVPRYNITPGAALNTLVTWTDAAIERARA